jgi:hypothetical protein
MTPNKYIKKLPAERRATITALRELILKHDKQVTEVVSDMMGKQLLLYNTPEGIMKYGLASPKQYMSFHSLVMYASSSRFGGSGLRERYAKLLPKAKFQAGCVNFKSEAEFPLDVAENFIKEMAKVEYPPPEFRNRMIANEEKRKKAAAKKKKNCLNRDSSD